MFVGIVKRILWLLKPRLTEYSRTGLLSTLKKVAGFERYCSGNSGIPREAETSGNRASGSILKAKRRSRPQERDDTEDTRDPEEKSTKAILQPRRPVNFLSQRQPDGPN
jgi:hypothetical protein